MQGTITLIQVSRIETPAAMGMVIGWVREYFRDAKWPQPPLPENVLGLVPCALLVTEIEGTRRFQDR